MLAYKRSLILTFIAGLSTASLALFYFYTSFTFPTIRPTYHLSIVAAHNEKIKELVIPFLQQQCKKKFNAHLYVEWVKHGGQNTNVKVIEATFKKTQGTTCGHDVIWGGGEIIFHKLEKNKRLAQLCLPDEIRKNIPEQIAATPLYSKTWVAACLSGFGMIYNKPLFKKLGLPLPKTWQDLASTSLFDKVISIDPCQSSNIWTIYAMILQSYGWEKGWQILTQIAANSVVFLDKSSSAASSVAQGLGLIAPTNDLYAQGTIHMHGSENLGFIFPLSQTIINADPIAILAGAPNKKMAQFCVECILSPEFQCLLMLKKQTPHGPTNYTVGRIAVNKRSYEMAKKSDIGSAIDPFTVSKGQVMHMDTQKAIKQYPIVSALFRACCIIPHKQLKKAWKLTIQHGCKPEDIHHLTIPPLTQEEIQAYAKIWKDALSRQKLIIAWTNQAIARYQQIIHKYKD